MTWQIINIGLDLLLILQVIYLFTSGQPYMREAIERNDRSFFVEQTLYLMLGLSAACEAYFLQDVAAWVCVKTLFFALLLLRKCVTAYKHKHSKTNSHAVV